MLIAIYHNAWASDGRKDDTPVIKALQSGKKTKRLEGATLKIARPILKKTPISAIIDDIDMMIICPVEKNEMLKYFLHILWKMLSVLNSLVMK